MQFIQAKNYRPGRIERVRLLVVHDMEAPEARSTAENVARWFAGPNAPLASAHWCHDSDSTVGCVHVGDTAYHAPGANADGIGHELAGYASQTRSGWLDAYGLALLDTAAKQFARDAKQFGIPLRYVTDKQLADGRSAGITSHRQITRVFGLSTHTDPGSSFPFDRLLSRVQFYAGQLDRSPVSSVDSHLNTPTLRHAFGRGAHGKDVIRWKRRMAARGWKLDAASWVYGERAEEVCRAFQREKHLKVDGIVGPDTWSAAWAAPVT